MEHHDGGKKLNMQCNSIVLSRIGLQPIVSLWQLLWRWLVHCIVCHKVASAHHLVLKWTERSKGGRVEATVVWRRVPFAFFISVVEWFLECVEMIDWCSFASCSSHALLWKCTTMVPSVPVKKFYSHEATTKATNKPACGRIV